MGPDVLPVTRERVAASLAGDLAGVMRCLLAGGNFNEALATAKALRMPQSVVATLEKALVDFVVPITTVQATAFFSSSSQYGLIDRLAADSAARTAPLNTSLRVETSMISASSRTPGQKIPLSSLTTAGGYLSRMEVAVIVAVTKELARAGGAAAEAFISLSARSGIAMATDTVAMASLIETGTVDASATSFAEAVAAAIAGLGTTPMSRVYLALGTSAAKLGAASIDANNGVLFPQLTCSGGQVGAHPAVVSAGLGSLDVVAIDADGLVINSGTLAIDVSREADLEMDDTTTPGATNMVSLFQTNSSALRLVREFGVESLRADAISRVTITPGS